MKEKEFKKESQAMRAIKKEKHPESVLNFLENNKPSSDMFLFFSKLDSKILANLHAYDYGKNGLLLKHKKRNEIYETFVSETTIYENQVKDALTKDNLNFFIKSHIYLCDTREKEIALHEILTKSNFEINDKNVNLLWESPVVLHYYLSNPNITNEEKSRALSKRPPIDKEKSLSYAPEPASDELLDKIGEDIRRVISSLVTDESANNSYLQLHANAYIALAGLKNGDLPTTTFLKNCFRNMEVGDKNVSVKNIATIFYTLKNNGLIVNKPSNEYVSKFIMADNGVKYNNKHELEEIIKFMKTFEINPFLIDPHNLKSISSELKDNGIITPEDEIAISKNLGSPFNRYEYSFTFEESYSELLDELNYDPRPNSYKEAILMMHEKGKMISELSHQEANIFIVYAKKILEEKGIFGVDISFSYDGYKSENPYNGEATQKGSGYAASFAIKLTPNNRTIKNLMHVIFHETNHIIQNRSCINMDLNADMDLIDFGQDELMRKIDPKYYNTNYLHFSKEFDADFSAYLQSADFFSDNMNEKFEDLLSEYDNLKSYYSDNVRHSSSEGEMNLNELFTKKLKELYDNDPVQYFDVTMSMQLNHPILEIEYNIDTGEPRSVDEIVEMINELEKDNTPEAKNKIKACKYVLKSRCNPDKVGPKAAEACKKQLESKLSKTTPVEKKIIEIDEYRDRYQKYQEIFNLTLDKMKKPTKQAGRL